MHLANLKTGLNTHINDIVNTLVFEDLKNVILVGYSYGGMVITGVVDSIPERIRSMIYVDVMIPKDGESYLSIRESNNNLLL